MFYIGGGERSSLLAKWQVCSPIPVKLFCWAIEKIRFEAGPDPGPCESGGRNRPSGGCFQTHLTFYIHGGDGLQVGERGTPLIQGSEYFQSLPTTVHWAGTRPLGLDLGGGRGGLLHSGP